MSCYKGIRRPRPQSGKDAHTNYLNKSFVILNKTMFEAYIMEATREYNKQNKYLVNSGRF